MFFAKKIIVLSLVSCCAFLSFAGKIKAPPKAELEKAFKANGEWCFFTIPKSSSNRMTYFNKNRYKICKEGDLFKKVIYKNKYYARDLKNNIYKPHWQMKKDFSTQLIPAEKYTKFLDNKIKSSEKTIKDLKQKVSEGQIKLDYNEERYNHYKSYRKYKVGYRNYSSVIKSKLKYYKKTLKQQQDIMKKLTRNLNNSEKKLKTQQTSKTKAETLYKKYAGAKK
jgi:hypothetical protein